MESSVTVVVVSIFSILVGISIIIFWFRLHLKKKLFETTSTRTPIETKYHVIAELLTASLLIAGGVALLLVHSSLGTTLSLIGLGMLLYANINGPGIYASKGDKSMVRTFYAVMILTVIMIVIETV